MVLINEKFLHEVLWKEYQKYARHLEKLVDEITDNIISKIHEDEDESITQGELRLEK